MGGGALASRVGQYVLASSARLPCRRQALPVRVRRHPPPLRPSRPGQLHAVALLDLLCRRRPFEFTEWATRPLERRPLIHMPLLLGFTGGDSYGVVPTGSSSKQWGFDLKPGSPLPGGWNAAGVRHGSVGRQLP